MKMQLKTESMTFICDHKTQEIVAVIKDHKQALEVYAFFKSSNREVVYFREEVAIGTEEDWG